MIFNSERLAGWLDSTTTPFQKESVNGQRIAVQPKTLWQRVEHALLGIPLLQLSKQVFNSFEKDSNHSVFKFMNIGENISRNADL